ncbi:hypothetical protein F5Y12DRAFT_756906 [Xylaria sp. FL1777]|nr:hypothetical protein F5Y12DRAFT_756906 [Xylaria sp. FL1777]
MLALAAEIYRDDSPIPLRLMDALLLLYTLPTVLAFLPRTVRSPFFYVRTFSIPVYMSIFGMID